MRRSPRTVRSLLVCMVLLPTVARGIGWAQTIASRATPATDAAAADNDTLEKSRVSASAVAVDHADDNSYVVGPGDVLAINVWKEPDISKVLPVRSDGKISLPLVGELQASGKTPQALQEDIATRLQAYISEPEVTVIVQEIKSQRFNILGYVTKPGTYLLTDSTTVLDAIAMAGGFRDFAKPKAIYVLRTNPDGSKKRLPFNYKEVIKGANQHQNVVLEPHDTVVVP